MTETGERGSKSTVAKSLKSEDPITRALAMIDARVGKRRLRQLASRSDEHPLVRLFLGLRCEAEGVSISTYAA